MYFEANKQYQVSSCNKFDFIILMHLLYAELNLKGTNQLLYYSIDRGGLITSLTNSNGNFEIIPGFQLLEKHKILFDEASHIISNHILNTDEFKYIITFGPYVFSLLFAANDYVYCEISTLEHYSIRIDRIADSRYHIGITKYGKFFRYICESPDDVVDIIKLSPTLF